MSLKSMYYQRSNFKRIHDLYEAGFSSASIASLLQDKGCQITASQLDGYYYANLQFAENRYLSREDVRKTKAPFDSYSSPSFA